MVSPHIYVYIYIYIFFFTCTHTYISVYSWCRSNTILWWQHRTHLKLTHTSTSIWNISYFRPWSWRNCTCVDNKFPDLFTDICIKTIKFLMSTLYLGFRILGFYHRVQWRGAKTAGKKCWGSCHWMMPSLLDFAQNCSLQIEWWNQKLERHILFTGFRQCNWAVHFACHGVPKLMDLGLGCQRSCLDLSSVSAGQPTLSAQHACSACCGNIAVRQLRKESQSVYRRWWPKLIEAFPQKHVFVDMSVFLWLRKQRPRFAQGQPKSNFQMKELDRTAKTIVPMNVEWRYRRLSVLSSMCQHVATLQFVSCAKRQPFRSNGASSSQGWRIRIVIQQPEFDPWVSHRSMPLWTWVFSCGCASNGQDSPKASSRAIFKGKNLIEPPKLLSQWMLNEGTEGWACRVQRANMWQHCSLSAVQRKKAFSFPWRKLLPVVAQATAKIRPRPAQGLLSKERTW